MMDGVILQLVEHYSQPVYQDEAEQAFQVLHESSDELTLPAVVKHLLGLLKEEALDKDTSTQILVDLIHAYENSIRPGFLGVSDWGSFHIQSAGVSVLLHFEMLLQSYVNSLDSMGVPIRLSMNVNVSDSLELMASDVTILTSSAFRSEEGQLAGQHVLADTSLKALWRLIESALKVSSKSPGVLTKRSMRRLVCSLFDCTKQSIDPLDIEPLLPERLFCISEYWAFPPTAERDFLEDRLAAEPMDYSLYRSSGNVWIDPHTEDTVIPAIWKYLLLSCAEDSMREETVQELICDEIQRMVLCILGLDEIIKSFRAHFFGRDMVSPKSEHETKVTPRYDLNLGHWEKVSRTQEQAERQKNTMNSRPYEKIPSRLHALLNFLSLLKTPDDPQVVQVGITELIPVCYELLAASNDVSIGKGSLLLLHLLKMIEVHSFSDGRSHLRPFLEQADNLFTALDIVIKTCRDGCTLVFVGSAQRTLLRLLNAHRSDVQMRRRQSTQQWFSILDAARHRTQDERLVWGILIVLIPLLHDHVLQENADALEIGRLGISALLPIVRLTETSACIIHGPQVPLLAVVALSNLVMAAHPMMHKHANKLICELVACLGYLKSSLQVASVDSKTENEKMVIYLHVTGTIVVVCGSSGDRCISLLKDQNFNPTLDQCLDDVVATANTMLDRKVLA